MRTFILTAVAAFAFASCGVTKQLEKSARQTVLEDDALKTAHVGISVFEPASGKYWFNYQGDKYFVPASNTKIPTCYAAMKYLGDSLVGLRYAMSDSGVFKSGLVVQPTGDPTFLHRDFKSQPIFDFLKKELLDNDRSVAVLDSGWRDDVWGKGWSWNDFDANYMVERSSFPIYGNTMEIKFPDSLHADYWKNRLNIQPSLFSDQINRQWMLQDHGLNFSVRRRLNENVFWFENASGSSKVLTVPLITKNNRTTFEIIDKLLGGKKFTSNISAVRAGVKYRFIYDCNGECDGMWFYARNWHTIHSRPTDSLLKPMMHRSDNFFAEQSLLMVSNEMLGVMNDEKIIDTILKTDFKDLPHKPRWADGSGLSRYNLFTPQDFVFILNKMKNEFGMQRIKEVFPTGGEGTLSSYYKKDSTFIFAKTGTLSGVVALSGFLYTKGGKELIFSVLVNNHQASSTAVRRAVEKFIQGIREKY